MHSLIFVLSSAHVMFKKRQKDGKKTVSLPQKIHGLWTETDLLKSMNTLSLIPLCGEASCNVLKLDSFFL